MAIFRYSAGGVDMNRQHARRAAAPGRTDGSTFRSDVLRGLHLQPKSIDSKYLYDERGSQLFDTICGTDEYYPTRTEIDILRSNIDEIAGITGPNVSLMELGSGSSAKTRILLDHLPDIGEYIPIDISAEHLFNAADDIGRLYPAIAVRPVCADYTASETIPVPSDESAFRLYFFPGSTIGNFHPAEARAFLSRLRARIDGHGAVLIGVDLKKDPAILHRAYNDRAGVTAAFNINLLARMNRELGANFRTDRFRHYAFYDPKESRVEMHLVSLDDQSLRIGGTDIPIGRGESIHTENSYKYTPEEFRVLAEREGLRQERVWTDEEGLFSIQLLSAGSPGSTVHPSR
jgi:dimethylhistidine N-methyltransferase